MSADDYRLQQAMPYTIEGEQALLGILLCDPAVFGEVEGRLRATDFYDGVHQLVFAAMVNLNHAGELATLPAIHARIQDSDAYRKFDTAARRASVSRQEPEGVGFLATLADKAPVTSQAGHYCALVLDASARREIVRLGESLRSQAQRGQTRVEEIVSFGEGALHRVSVGAGWVDHVADGEAMYGAIEDIVAGRGKPAYLRTGLLLYDAVIGGLQMNRMNILGAPQKMGKTAGAVVLTRNIAATESSDGRRVGVHVFSLEMDMVELALRGACCCAFQRDDRHSPIYAAAAKGTMSDAMAARLIEGAQMWRDLPVTVDARAGLTIGQIEMAAKAQMRTWEKARIEPGLVVVDHIGLVKPDQDTGNRITNTGAVSAGLRDMFKSLGVTGLVLTQVNSRVDKTGTDDRRPELSDIAWSRDIGQDAAQVTFLYRPEAYLREPQQSDPDFQKKYLDYQVAKDTLGNRVFLINRANRMGASNEEMEFGMDIGRNAMWELSR